MKELTLEEMEFVSGGDFDGKMFATGLGFVMFGVGAAAALPFIGAGAAAAAGIAAGSAILGAGGSAVMFLSTYDRGC